MSRTQNRSATYRRRTRRAVIAQALVPMLPAAMGAWTASTALGVTRTWDGAPDGGGTSANANWSTGSNWVGDAGPSATGDNLIFAGTTNLTTVNDVVTTLSASGTALTFGATAGS